MSTITLLNVRARPLAARSARDGAWLRVALTATGVYAALLGLFVIAHKGDPSSLACMGSMPGLADQAGSNQGYDGKFYYVLAQNPWHTHSQSEIDLPAVRHVRILYPALAWLLSGGGSARLFWALPTVNLLALGLLAGLGAVCAGKRGLNPWWGLLLPAAVGAALAALRDLTDVVSCCAVAGLLVARLRGWHPAWLLLAAGAALFSREQNVVIVALVLAVTLWERCGWTALGLAGVVALWAAWIVTLRLTYGSWPMLPAQGNVSLPLSGLRYALTHLEPVGHGRLTLLINVGCLLALACQVGLLGYLASLRPDPALLLMGLAGLGLVLTAGTYVYSDRWSIMRVFAWLPLATWLGCAEARRPWALGLMALPGLLPLYEILHDVYLVL